MQKNGKQQKEKELIYERNIKDRCRKEFEKQDPRENEV